MNRFINPNTRTLRMLVFILLLLGMLSVVGIAGASDRLVRPKGLLDGGGFPTPTPTATLIPTQSFFTETPTLPPANLIPTATGIPYPFPTFDSNLVGGSESQTTPESGATSPSLLVLALPFLCALSLLVGVVVYWFRNSRMTAE